MTAPVPVGSDPSPRELEVLRLLADGLDSPQIAAKLTLSPHTVKTHIARLLDRLGADSRAQAVALGYERRLLVPAWDTGRANAQLAAARQMAGRWAGLTARTGRDAVLRDAGQALLKVIGAGPAGVDR